MMKKEEIGDGSFQEEFVRELFFTKFKIVNFLKVLAHVIFNDFWSRKTIKQFHAGNTDNEF